MRALCLFLGLAGELVSVCECARVFMRVSAYTRKHLCARTRVFVCGRMCI